MNRTSMLAQLDENKTWDVVIIGGGATGLGVAVDAVTRGLSTLLIEADDFAKGTSSRSTKLVHGGVRYLEQGNLKLVREALRERGWLLKNAPNATKKLGFIIPAFSLVQQIYFGTGLKFYDVLAGKLSLGKTKILKKKTTINFLPGINQNNLSGGIVYYDGQFDDARLAISLAKTAVKHGAVLINYCEAISLLKTEVPAGKQPKVCGIVAEDVLTNKTFEIKSKTIINATGVFADDILQMDNKNAEDIITPSQGIHLIIDKKFFPGNHAMMIPKTDDKRVLFAVPWHNKVILGTTDTEVKNISDDPLPLQEEIDYILKHINRYLSTNITLNDVTSMYAGLRPLVKTKGVTNTSLLSRDHIIIVSHSNLITITGGKWTTYRKMAEDAVNNAVFVGKIKCGECITHNLPIEDNAPAIPDYDNSIENIYSLNNIRDFIENEMAVCVEDILARRTRLLFLDARKAIQAAPFVAKQMAAILHKDDSWIQSEVNSFTSFAKQYLPAGKMS
ncbi:glycerol-3-phosphate dehydrogenase/oxidase [Parafilimonas terrae]|uniref:Glycerol-3-phosphate dehydrogenase n=1 Tax=Parafilimonas terrae TaxID=1465490 RepID=A0A1I5U587_9BACT|nr:glycerol-3-phosphate dehydrogenase/oxidase [Parafilimonas terrae]SFP90087.1 glycerol-3-phosphate dehydrogenase [Parafilimonas terrae]